VTLIAATGAVAVVQHGGGHRGEADRDVPVLHRPAPAALGAELAAQRGRSAGPRPVRLTKLAAVGNSARTWAAGSSPSMGPAGRG